MLYNSPQFLFFFLVVYSLYLVLRHKQQNAMLLVASYIFYGAWSWKYLFLIILSTLSTYWSGLQIQQTSDARNKKVYLWLGIVFNLAMLFLFKYYNFFAENLAELFQRLGMDVSLPFLQLLLPVGISFYTFQGIAYVVDVYRGRIAAVRNVMDYALFKAFFPQLVAGPIERAENLLPQVLSPRRLSWPQIEEGLYLIFQGLFQKVFLADNLARFVNPVFSAGAPVNGIQSLLVCYAFTFQIFFDFAGYSNIARGLAKVMGFELMVNFNKPYLSTSIQEFWNRWHISLSGWVKDYLYTPIFLSLRLSHSKLRAYTALLISMFLMGLWHGAGWTFIVFGLYHGVLLVLYAVLKPYLAARPRFQLAGLTFLWFWVRVFFVFQLVTLGMLIFRAQSLSQVGVFLQALTLDGKMDWVTFYYLKEFALYGLFLLLFEKLEALRKESSAYVTLKPYLRMVMTGFLAAFLVVAYSLGLPGGNAFIYFQF